MRIVLLLLSCLLTFDYLEAQTPIKIGVPTALTGDAAAFGLDIKNALSLMNERFGKGRYDLLFEDEKCINRDAVSVAQKLINVDKVRYVLGFPCNQTLLASAPLYDRAGVLALSASGTSGDVQDIGKQIFRIFPSDVGAANLLYKYIADRHKKLTILTEQNEYPIMMDRTMRRANAEAGGKLEIVSVEFVHGETDLRSPLLSAISKGTDAIFVNANTDASFISAVQQLRTLAFKGARYGAYIPASTVVMQTLGKDVDGFVLANLPPADDLVTAAGRDLLAEFKRRFGPPQSGFPVVPTSFEAYRVLDLAIQSGKDPAEYLRTTSFSGGYLPDWHFDEHGASQGIPFQMQKIEKGSVTVLK